MWQRWRPIQRSRSRARHNRTPIRAFGFYTTSNGDAVHEGTFVRTVAFLPHAAYSDTGTGESVNCYTPGSATNDIHLALVKAKPTASTDECQSYTAPAA